MKGGKPKKGRAIESGKDTEYRKEESKNNMQRNSVAVIDVSTCISAVTPLAGGNICEERRNTFLWSPPSAHEQMNEKAAYRHRHDLYTPQSHGSPFFHSDAYVSRSLLTSPAFTQIRGEHCKRKHRRRLSCHLVPCYVNTKMCYNARCSESHVDR